MHLSNEIQAQLIKLGSSVKISSTINGGLPDKYAFLLNGDRQFDTEFTDSENEFSIVLLEGRSERSYNHCFARGIFNKIERLANVIDLWVGKQKSAAEIKSQFDELELFEDFKIKNPNPDIDFAWMKIKNRIFNDLKFWKNSEWNNRYLELLNKAKEHPTFKELFLFTSLHWLMFSMDKDLKETWELNTFIIPTVYSNEVPETQGRFYVSYNDKPMGGQHFKTVDEALDFYAEKLKEIKPTRWTN